VPSLVRTYFHWSPSRRKSLMWMCRIAAPNRAPSAGRSLICSETIHRVPNHSGIWRGRLPKDCLGLTGPHKITVILDPDLDSAGSSDLRQLSNRFRNPALLRGPIRSRLDRVTENSQTRPTQFRGQIRQSFSFSDPMPAFGRIGRMKSATCIQARDGLPENTGSFQNESFPWTKCNSIPS
jgi:hypothetical protein